MGLGNVILVAKIKNCAPIDRSIIDESGSPPSPADPERAGIRPIATPRVAVDVKSKQAALLVGPVCCGYFAKDRFGTGLLKSPNHCKGGLLTHFADSDLPSTVGVAHGRFCFSVS